MHQETCCHHLPRLAAPAAWPRRVVSVEHPAACPLWLLNVEHPAACPVTRLSREGSAVPLALMLKEELQRGGAAQSSSSDERLLQRMHHTSQSPCKAASYLVCAALFPGGQLCGCSLVEMGRPCAVSPRWCEQRPFGSIRHHLAMPLRPHCSKVLNADALGFMSGHVGCMPWAAPPWAVRRVSGALLLAAGGACPDPGAHCR